MMIFSGQFLQGCVNIPIKKMYLSDQFLHGSVKYNHFGINFYRVPSNIPIKKKMLYASSKDALKKAFPDCGAEFQADCPDDLSHTDIEAKVSSWNFE